MKHHLCGSLAILEGKVLPLEPEVLDPYGLKLPLFHRHIMDVSNFVMPARGGGVSRIQRMVLSPTNSGDIRLQDNMAWSVHDVTSTAFRTSSGDEEHCTSQTSISQFVEVPRSMSRDDFTRKSACVFFS